MILKSICMTLAGLDYFTESCLNFSIYFVSLNKTH